MLSMLSNHICRFIGRHYCYPVKKFSISLGFLFVFVMFDKTISCFYFNSYCTTNCASTATLIKHVKMNNWFIWLSFHVLCSMYTNRSISIWLKRNIKLSCFGCMTRSKRLLQTNKYVCKISYRVVNSHCQQQGNPTIVVTLQRSLQ